MQNSLFAEMRRISGWFFLFFMFEDPVLAVRAVHALPSF